MNIRKLDTDHPVDVNQFIQFPFVLYKDNPLWVPPLVSEMKLVLNRRKHPFYQHSEADFFVVEKEGETLGRIAVLHNHNYSAHHGAKIGFFYYYDSIQDPAVSQLLFAAAVDWARQRDLDQIIGPKGFSRSSGIGALVEGFDFLPAMGIAYNFPYYDQLIKNAGFVKETDYLSGYMVPTQHMPDRIIEIAEKVKQRNNFWIEAANKQEMRQWIGKINAVHHEAFHNNPGYYPTTDEEFTQMANGMIQIAEPEMVKLIMKADDVVGFIISYPNVGRALRKTGGRIWPLGWFWILLEKSRAKIVDLNGLGLLPKYHGLGANALLYAEVEKTLRGFSNMEIAEVVQVDERNFKSKSDMENVGVNWHKRHRLYHLDLKQGQQSL